MTLALFAAACASDGAGQIDAADQAGAPASAAQTTASTASPPESDSTAATDDTAAPATEATRPEPDPNRPLAPDFQLALATGELYQLSADTKPVFLVFWAEW